MAACARDAAGSLYRAPDDLSLCHGAGGIAEALLAAGEPWAGQAVAVLRSGIDPEAGAGGAGRSPGLLAGRSGVGLLCLRLLDPLVPSVLLVRPGQVDSSVSSFIRSEQSGKGGAT